MKIIKRDGRVVDYNREKIVIAIEKANTEVRENEKANQKEIKEITKYIEELNKKRILVEDIQDIIEQKLMEMKKYELAKKYIVYRYTRALVRKRNTTDESILGLIKNKKMVEPNSKEIAILASTQRDYIAGEVSKDLTRRMLLPEKITKAHEEGILYFHDAEYFLQPIFNSCLINIEDMLENTTVMNGNLIESPKCFQVACTVTTQIIAGVGSNQYGGQSIDIKYLGKYLRKSKEKLENELKDAYNGKIPEEIINEMVEKRLKEELTAGVQTLQYQINTLMTIKGKPPIVTLFLNLDNKNEYIKENAMIVEEILKQRYEGVKDENGEYITPHFPKLVYVLYEHNCLKGGEYDYITNLAIKCIKKRLSPNFISAKKMQENYEGNVFSPMECTSFLPVWKDDNGKYKSNGRFNQGVVSINLPQIGIVADGDETKFWKIIDERLELCFEALMCRHYALLGTLTYTSPIHWEYGAISRLKKGEKIDKFLKEGYSSLSLGYIGIYELTKLIKGESHKEEEGKKFALKVMQHLNETVQKWKEQTGIGFVLYGVPSDNISNTFAKIDKEKFGIIKDITEKGFYTNSYHIENSAKISVLEKLEIEKEFQEMSLGGGISYVNIDKIQSYEENMQDIVRYIYNNIQYVGFIKNENA